jgi:SAM-dependent methyltransferase
VLADVVDALACPNCGGALTVSESSLHCAVRHSFDVARQGYVSLLSGHNRGIAGDTAEMVAARADFLGAGHFTPIVEAVVREAARVADGVVLDVGAGPGHYLAGVVDAARQPGLAVDVSKYAARRAARAHPRIGSVVADVWRSLPVRGSSVSVILNVFAPRNAAEMHRALKPGGHLVLVTPNPAHLRELVSGLGLLTVDAQKRQRLDEQLGQRFSPVRQEVHEFRISLRRAEINAVVGMGPSAWHAGRNLPGRLAALPGSVTVTASVTVTVLRRE